MIQLRATIEADLPIFFRHQLDTTANYMAAFTAKDPTDQAAFFAHWDRVLANPAILKQTILYDEQVAGYMAQFDLFGQPSVGYWIGREYWGQGVATEALRLFVAQIPLRPLYARVAKDNHGSRRVLEKCGFLLCGEDKGFAEARQAEIEEWIFELASATGE